MTDTPRTDDMTENARTMAEVLESHERLEREIALLRTALFGIRFRAFSTADARRRAEIALQEPTP